MTAIEIIEVGPRDGLQNQAETLGTADKIDFIERLIGAGAKRLEIASFVNPARVPQMADAEAVIARIPARTGVTRVGLVLNLRGVERAIASGIDEIGVVAVASDIFGVRNQKQTSAESVEMAVAAIEKARDAGVPAQVTIATAFGCPFEGEVPAARVAGMARRLAAAGPTEIALADTIGVAVPAEVERLFRMVAEAVPGMPLRAHFHNTRNTGIANALKALECGVTRLDASAGGIGGCPFAPRATGNIGTEDLVYALERSGVGTGFDLEKLTALAPWLAGKLKIAEVPAMLSRAGGFPKGG
ncbi:MAG: hydroxymethylglutaryl-CoA lyase [Micropepsaceae bacterium]